MRDFNLIKQGFFVYLLLFLLYFKFNILVYLILVSFILIFILIKER
jgi:hypothetical protein